MLGLMMETPLLVTEILHYATTAHGKTEVVSRNVDGSIHRYSYVDAKKRSLKLSAALVPLGVKFGDRVGSLAWNTHHHFELFYGVTGQGIVLHTVNPRLFEETLVKIISHAEDQWMFIDPATLSLAEALAPHLKTVKGWIYMDNGTELPKTSLQNVLSYEALLQAANDNHEWPSFDERTASIICYTSGTTGDPKGIVYTHRSIVLASLFMSSADMIGVYRPGELEAAMPIAPMFHANGWMMPFSAPMNGQKLVLPGRNFEPEKLCELIRNENVTVSAAVPTVWMAIINHLTSTGLTLPSLRAAMIAGTKAPPALVQDLERRGHQVGQIWGMTEIAGGLRGTPPPGMPADQHFEFKLRQGRLGFGTQLRIIDDNGVSLPHDGVAMGHLEVRGPIVASGYYRQPTATANGWLSTGDVARVHEDGSVEIVDRSKDVIKSGGEWISSMAIESAALEHPKIQQAAVIAMEHPKWQERPLLVLVTKPGAQVSDQEIRDHLVSRISKWWMPDKVVFAEALPMTASGKVRKAELRASLGKQFSSAAE